MKFVVAGAVVLTVLIGIRSWAGIKAERHSRGGGLDGRIHKSDFRAVKRALRRRLIEDLLNPRPGPL